MNIKDLSVGDVILVRQWDDMANEFGFASRGVINCKFHFTDAMKPYCGEEYIVSRIQNDGRIRFKDADIGYSFSADMLEPINAIPIASDLDLISMLEG